MRRIRWDVRPYIHTMTHPVTGETTIIYDAVRVSIAGPDFVHILPSELDRAKARAIREARKTPGTGPIVVTPIYADYGARSVAYVVAYRCNV